jgi:PAS domain S-box-containing protein
MSMVKSTAESRSSQDLHREAAEDFSWMHDALDIAPVGVFRCDASGAYTYVNERWCELTGRRPEEMIGTSSTGHIHPDDRDRLAQEWERTAHKGMPFRWEYRYLRPDGTIRWILGRVNAARGTDGAIVGYIGASTDITELHLARVEIERVRNELEDRVRERTRKLHEIAMVFEQSNDAIVSSNLNADVVSWNRAAEQLYGYTAAEAIGTSVLNLVPPSERTVVRELMRRVRAGESVTNLETVRVAKSGALIEVSLSLFPLRGENGTISGTCAIVRDISERKKTERRLQQLTRRLHHAHDEERRRVARDLHDSTAQVLAALTMNLAALGRPIDLATHHRLLDDSVSLAQQVVRELRTQSYLLHPPLLDAHGLTVVLRCFVEGFTVRSGIAVELDLPEDFPRLPEECEAALFRVAQEALANVHRHSQSPHAHITLRMVNRAAELAIRDFGRGLARDAAKIAGVGVAGMKERLKQLGGSLFIARAKPGTCVVATLPLD